MKKIVWFFCLAIFANATVYLPYDDIDFYKDGILAIDKNKTARIDKDGKLLSPFVDGDIWYAHKDVFAVVHKNGFVSLMDKKGKVLLKPDKYTYIESYDDKHFRVGKSRFDTLSLIDNKGKIVKLKEKEEKSYKGRVIKSKGYDKYSLLKGKKTLVPFGKYDSMEFVPELDLVKVANNYEHGYLDLDGKVAIPCKYTKLFYLDMGYIAFKTNEYLWGLMDKKGKIVLKAQYDNIKQRLKLKNAVEIILDGRHGVLGSNLKEILPPKYSYISKASDFHDLLELELNGKKTIVDGDFKEVLKDLDYDMVSYFATDRKYLEFKKDGLMGVYDSKGVEILPIKYNYISKIGKYFRTTLDGKYGVSRENGKELIGNICNRLDYMKGVKLFICSLDKDTFLMNESGKKINISEFENGFFLTDKLFGVQKDGKWGLIDDDKNVVLEAKYEDLRPFIEDKLLFGVGGVYGIMDTKGKVLMEPEFKIIKRSGEGFFQVSKDGLIGFIDAKSASYAIKPQFKFIDRGFRLKEQKIIIGYTKQRHGLINVQKRKLIVPAKYDKHTQYTNGLIKVYKGKHWAVYDLDGKKVFEKANHKSKVK